MKKQVVLRLIILALVAAAIVVVVAIGVGRRGGRGTMRFALVPKSIGHPYWEGVREGMAAAAKRLGVEAKFWGPPEASVDQQITIIENLIAQGYDGIAISPNDPESVKEIIKRAMAKGIAVVTFDSDAPKSERLLYIGTDNREGGRVGAREMVKLLGAKPGDEAAEKLQVQIVGGQPGAWNLNERIDGFKDGVKGTNIALTDVQYNMENSETARQVADAALTAYPKLRGFFGSNAFAGPGAGLVIKGRGKKPGEIRVVAFDTTEDILDLIKQGYIDCTLAQNTRKMGKLSVEKLVGFAKQYRKTKVFERPIEDVIDTGVTVVRPKDVPKYRPKAKKDK